MKCDDCGITIPEPGENADRAAYFCDRCYDDKPLGYTPGPWSVDHQTGRIESPQGTRMRGDTGYLHVPAAVCETWIATLIARIRACCGDPPCVDCQKAINSLST